MTRSVQVHARAFGKDLDDFIKTARAGDSAGTPIFVYQNVGEARTAGLDLGGDPLVGPATFSASRAYLAPRTARPVSRSSDGRSTRPGPPRHSSAASCTCVPRRTTPAGRR